jgi:nitroimidazol reductase NimA-like FMN-containing flavoprotein (pyridoxamine 5'-phosphate oxidase superfamily)
MSPAEDLSRVDCLLLLGRMSLGRVAFSERALPAIRTVGYTLVGSSLVLSAGTEQLARHLDGQVVAFEVDEIDPVDSTGWSVVVTGDARILRHPGELMRQHRTPMLDPRADSSLLVRLVPGQMTGHRI